MPRPTLRRASGRRRSSFAALSAPSLTLPRERGREARSAASGQVGVTTSPGASRSRRNAGRRALSELVVDAVLYGFSPPRQITPLAFPRCAQGSETSVISKVKIPDRIPRGGRCLQINGSTGISERPLPWHRTILASPLASSHRRVVPQDADSYPACTRTWAWTTRRLRHWIAISAKRLSSAVKIR
jgi:hypothetical protein